MRIMKIATVTEDEVTISHHFGRAPYYLIYTVEDGKIVDKELRDKAGHHTFAAHHTETAPGQRHGYDSGAQSRHAAMAGDISDCQVLIAGGMGWGAFESMKSYNIDTVVTDIDSIDEAVKLYIEGKLPNLIDRLH
jgi:predicted Fe-Mo cluster-binding NifX family protein